MKERVRKEKREEISLSPWPPVCRQGVLNIPGGPYGGHEDQDQGGLCEGSGRRLGFVSELCGYYVVMPKLQVPRDHRGANSDVKHIRVFITSSRARSPTIHFAVGQKASSLGVQGFYHGYSKPEEFPYGSAS